MTGKLIFLAMAIVLLLVAVTPALADSNPNKDLCKGSDYVYTVATQDGQELSETVYLSWEDLFASRSVLDVFPNQGRCVSHVNHGKTLYFVPCAHLKSETMRDAAMCYTRAWLSSAAGQ